MSAAYRGEYDAVQRFVPVINGAKVEEEALKETHKKTTKELTDAELEILRTHVTLGFQIVSEVPALRHLAAVIVAMLPFFVMYPFVQKYFTAGVTMGAVKE